MMYDIFAQAGYKYVKYLGDGQHILLNINTKTQELWFSNKYHANYGLLYKNTHLEFAREVK